MPIKVRVGPDEHGFYIHPSVISQTSDFFKAALKKEWAEGQERIIKLPEDDPVIFETYVQWLYTGTIFCKTREEYHNYNLLADLYIQGEKLIDTFFQDAVVNAIVAATRSYDVDGSRSWPGERTVNIIYENTTEGSPARKLMLDIWHDQADSSWRCESTKTLTQEFLADLTFALIKKCENGALHGRRLTSDDTCAYHKHAKEEPCGVMGR